MTAQLNFSVCKPDSARSDAAAGQRSFADLFLNCPVKENKIGGGEEILKQIQHVGSVVALPVTKHLNHRSVNNAVTVPEDWQIL